MNTRSNPVSAPPTQSGAILAKKRKQPKKVLKKPASKKKPALKKRKGEGNDALHVTNIDQQKRKKQTKLTESVVECVSANNTSQREKSVSTSMDTSTIILDIEALQIKEEQNQTPSSRWISASGNIVSVGIAEVPLRLPV